MTRKLIELGKFGIENGVHKFVISTERFGIIASGKVSTYIDDIRHTLALHWADNTSFTSIEYSLDENVEASFNDKTNEKIGFILENDNKKIIVYFMSY